MTETITVNGVDRSSVIRRENVELVEHAYLGEVGQGRLQIDDAAGTITVPGFKDITVVQSDSTPSRIFTGFAHRKGIRRGETYSVGASREYGLATLDGNDLLRRRIIRGTDGKRPKETITQRTNWLVANELSLVDVFDFGAVASSTVKLDKADHRGQYPIDVLSAMAKAVSWNCYVRWNTTESAWELVWRNDNTSTADTCTLSISNVLSDVNGTTVFPPFQEAELNQDPEHVYSGAYATHAKGRVYETDASTATAFTERDGVTEDSGTRLDSTASRDAKRFLRNSDTEEQLLPVMIRVPSSKVGLVQAGQRISTRMSHMAPEGWDPAIYARILRLRRTQPRNTDAFYDLAMDLSPQEEGPGDTSCPYELTEAGTFYPIGFDQVQDGWNWSAQPSDGVVYYLRPGYSYPTVPTVGHLGNWHFPAPLDPSEKGAGSANYAGDCAQNTLQFILVGAGTLTVQTEVYAASPQIMAGSWGESPDAYANSVGTFTSGDAVEFVLTGECVNIVRLYDGPGQTCGGKWGWSEAVWVPA
jgi:hypothetical protein